jgi:hypothetical protein
MEKKVIETYTKEGLIQSIKSHYARTSPYDWDDYTVEFEIKDNQLIGAKLVLIKDK